MDLTSADIISIDRVLEASAGTGKTYTLVELTANIIEQKDIPLNKILIVTYTEKAAGELKTRLLAALRDRFSKAKEQAVKNKLKFALENYDHAAIYTIHAFCRKMLSQYAFENRQTGEFDLISDKEVYETMLRKIQRQDWQAWYGDNMEAILNVDNYPAYNRKDKCSVWESRVLSAADRWNPGADDILLPEVMEKPGKKAIDAVFKLLFQNIMCLSEFVDKHEGMDSFIKLFDSLNLKAPLRTSIRDKILVPLGTLLSSIKGEGNSHNRKLFCEFFQSLKSCSQYGKKGIHLLEIGKSDFLANKFNLDDVFPDFETFSKPITDFMRLLKSILPSNLTIHKIKSLSDAHKTKLGRLSFQDLLGKVWDALEPNGENNILLGQLRERFTIALVDEFQDTDALQWKIFKRVFLDSGKNRILVIGDPKQSIYRFRGADVDTYMEARNKILTAHSQDKPLQLDTNYRSTKGMLDGLNKLFGDSGWFNEVGGIDYVKVGTPKKNTRIGITRDETSRAPVTIVDLCFEEKNEYAKRKFAEFTVNEIKKLLNKDGHGNCGKSALTIRDDEIERDINENDICILVKTRKEAQHFEDRLKRDGIAYSFYKKPGIWQSEEAENVTYLFGALAAPSDKLAVRCALLSQFLKPELGDLTMQKESNLIQDSEKLLEKWTTLGIERSWGKLFQSLKSESVILDKCLEKEDTERRITNIYQIFEYLEQEAVEKNLDIKGVSEKLGRLCRDTETDQKEDAALHRLETESPTVKIITMHSAKGLEFPIVFIGGGFGKGRHPEYFVFHSDVMVNGQSVPRVCIDTERADWNKIYHKTEEKNEDRRLLYVALTRAQYKIYLPKFAILTKDNTPHGNYSAGAISQILFVNLRAAWPHPTCNDMVRHITPEVNEIKADGNDDDGNPVWEKWKPDLIKTDEKEKTNEANEPDVGDINLVSDRFPTLEKSFWSRKVDLASFTGLHNRKYADDEKTEEKNIQEEVTQKTIYADISSWTPDEHEEAGDDDTGPGDTEKEKYADLPRGEKTGSMLHEVLEEIDFGIAAEKANSADMLADGQVSSLIDKKMIKFRFYKDKDDPAYEYRKKTAEYVYNALTVPVLDDGFRLCDLKPENKIHELEFWYPYPGTGEVDTKVLAGIKYNVKGYLNGFIDLIFRRDNTWYILDWKSNFLKDGYDADSMEAGMKESNYGLQYRIYILALCRWLRQCGIDFKFGGAVYLFLRGLNKENKGLGIYLDDKITENECIKNVKKALYL